MAEITPNKITDFFPQSPKSKEEDLKQDPVENVKEDESSCASSSIVPQPSEIKTAVSDLSNTSSVFLTPNTSPNKDDATEKTSENSGELKQQPMCRKSLIEPEETKSPAPKEVKKKGRRKKRGGTYTPTPKTTHSTTNGSKPKSARKKPKDTDTKKNSQITDFFPVRRSDRRCKSDLDYEKIKDLEYKVLHGIEDGLKVEDIQNKGRGVVATKPFRRGDFVVEYAGDRIDIKEAKDRETKYSKKSDIGCYMYYFTFKNRQYCIDATAESGKLGRLLNHSKTQGNCHTKLVEIKGNPYLILVASRDIAAGEELQYDYGDRSKDSLASHPWLKS